MEMIFLWAGNSRLQQAETSQVCCCFGRVRLNFYLLLSLLVSNVARYSLRTGEWSMMGNDSAFSNSVLYTNTMNSNGDVFIIGQEQVRGRSCSQLAEPFVDLPSLAGGLLIFWIFREYCDILQVPKFLTVLGAYCKRPTKRFLGCWTHTRTCTEWFRYLFRWVLCGETWERKKERGKGDLFCSRWGS